MESKSELELKAITHQLERLAQAVLAQMHALRDAMDSPQPGKALQDIITRDREVDSLELNLDDLAMVFINHRAPLGPPLRYMIGVLDCASAFERIGDCIEYVARHLIETPELKSKFVDAYRLLLDMTEKCSGIMENSITALIAKDIDMATKVPPMDNMVDALQDKAYDLMIQQVRGGKVDVELGMILVLLANKLESIADITCHIARTVIYIVSGSRKRHDDHEGDV